MWGISAWERVNYLYGLAVILLGFAALISWYTFMNWRGNAFRMVRFTIIGFSIAIALVVAFQLVIISTEQYGFIDSSAVFLSFNILPMINLVFRLSHGNLKPFESYKGAARTLKEKWLQFESVEGEGGLGDGVESKGTGLDATDEKKDEKKDEESTAEAEVDQKSSGESRGPAAPAETIAEARERRKYATVNSVLLGLAVAVLIAYGIFCYVRAPSRTQGVVGFITVGAVLCIDSLLISSLIDLKVKNPVVIVGLMLLGRIVLIAFGDQYYFIAHCIVFLFLAIPLGMYTVNAFVPPHKQQVGKFLFFSKLGFAPDSDAFRELQARQRGAKVTGLLGESRCAEWLYKNKDWTALFLACAIFAIDIAVVSVISTSKFSYMGSREFDQWVLGFMAYLFAIYSILSLLAWRLYSNNARQLTLFNALCAVGKNVFIAVGGIIVYVVSGSVFAMILLIFAPMLIDTVILFSCEWIKADFRLLQQGHTRSPPFAPFFWACFRCRLSASDYRLLLLRTSIYLLVGGMGLAIGLTEPSDTRYYGWTITLVLLTALWTASAMVQWFNTFKISLQLFLQISAALTAHILFTVLVASTVLDTVFSTKGGWLFFYCFGVLGGVLVLFALLKLKSDGWRVTTLVAVLIGGAALLVLALLIALTVLVLPVWMGLTAIGAYIMGILIYIPKQAWERALPGACIGRVAACWARVTVCCAGLQGRFRLDSLKQVAHIIVAVLAVVIGLVIALVNNNFFFGFSFVWLCLLVAMMSGTYEDFKEDFKSRRIGFISAPGSFPLFDVSPSGDVVENSSRVFYLYTECFMLFAWGAFAAFLYRRWFGLLVNSLSLSLAYLVTVYFKTKALLDFKEATQFLQETLGVDRFYAEFRQLQIDAARRVGRDNGLDDMGSLDDGYTTIGILNSEVKSIFGRIFNPVKRSGTKQVLMARQGRKDRASRGDSKGRSSRALSRANSADGDAHDAEMLLDMSMRDEGIVDWRYALLLKRRLQRMLPRTRWTNLLAFPGSCCVPLQRAAPTVTWRLVRMEGETKTETDLKLSRGDAIRHTMRYNYCIAKLFMMHTRFVVQSMVNTIILAAGSRTERIKKIVKMMGDRGVKISQDEFIGYHKLSLRRLAITEAYKRYLREEDERQEDEKKDDDEKQKDMEMVRRRMAEKERRRKEEERKKAEERRRREERERKKKDKDSDERDPNRPGHDERDSKDRDRSISVAAIVRNQYGEVPLYDERDDERGVDFGAVGRAAKTWADGKDPEFCVDDAKGMLFLDPENPRPRNRKWARFQWERLSEFIRTRSEEEDPPPELFANGVNADDIVQGRIGDCWLLSAIAVLAQYPARLKKVFLEKKVNERGIYAFRFFHQGQLRVVTIDDFIPLDMRGRSPVFAHGRDFNEMWVMLLEKAYAKMFTCYEAIEYGKVDEALTAMTNGISSRFKFTDAATKKRINNGAMWIYLLEHHRQGFLMGAGTPGKDDRKRSEWGLVDGHAYSILDVLELGDVQLVRLRNPHGFGEWNGDWSDDSDRWDQRMLHLLAEHKQRDAERRGVVPGEQGEEEGEDDALAADDDGAFYMEFQDFVVHFQTLYVCRFFDRDAGWSSRRFYGAWNETNGGGNVRSDRYEKNPQFLLTCPSKKTDIFINLSQDDTRGQFDEETGKEKKLAAIAIYLYANKGRPVRPGKQGKCIKYSAYQRVSDITVNWKLPRYATRKNPNQLMSWTVVISSWEENPQTNFLLKLFSDKDVTLEALPPV